VYVEPFAGGAGAALKLLTDEYVDEIVLNDLNPGIAAFWRAVFDETDALAKMVETSEVTIDQWHIQKRVYEAVDHKATDLELGYATFFMNRTNRSGILGARPIGGLRQTGRWKMDARFNRSNLAARIRYLGRYRNRVHVMQEDGVSSTSAFLGPDALVYADPPYVVRGSGLYLDSMSWADHERLASLLVGSTGRWLVTYGARDDVEQLYPAQRRARFSLAHTAARPRTGFELAFFSDRLLVDELDGLGKRAEFIS
jgi:DNA adenine methylase